jgi:HPt (histidine-containing phosphotransfer) domain-containing protein
VHVIVAESCRRLKAAYADRPALLTRVIDAYCGTYGPMLADMEHDAASGDWQSLARHAHRISGTLRALCGESVPEADVLLSAQEQDPEALQQRVGDLRRLLDDLASHLTHIRPAGGDG